MSCSDAVYHPLVDMNVNIRELYNVALLNIANNNLLPADLYVDWDCIDIKEDWLVPGWKIENVLTRRDKSPYFWGGYNGVPMRLSFYPLCFFSFFSGVMYSIIKNGNIVNHWDYWMMHKSLSSDFIMQSMLLYSGISSNNNMSIILGGGKDFDREGLIVYAIIHGVITHYFPDNGIGDFDIVDEDGFILDYDLSNLASVLETFHRLGAAMVAFSLSETSDEYRLKGKRIWGGKGMGQIFHYAR